MFAIALQFYFKLLIMCHFVIESTSNEVVIKDVKNFHDCPHRSLKPEELTKVNDEVKSTGDKRDSLISNYRHRRNVKDCTNFNLTLHVIPDSSKNSVTVFFNSTYENSHCYSYYQVILAKKTTNHEFRENNEIMCIIFDHVEKIFPCNITSRDDNCDDVPFVSKDIYIEKELIILESEPIKEGSNVDANKKNLILIFPAVLLIFMIFICLIVLYRKLKSRNSVVLSHQVIDKMPLEEYNSISPSDIEVVILHSNDESTSKKLKLLKDFLCNCLKFKVILMNEKIAEILISPHEWFRSHLEYSCSHLGDATDSRRRIILVEPEKAVPCQNLMSCEEEEEMENNFYRYAIELLRNNFPRCLKDYCHLFVVDFNTSDMKSQISQEFVPGVRYNIPLHLKNLCVHLCPYEGERKESFKRELSNKLITHDIMKNI